MTKLFGIFDHQIPLHSTERVTIIHGPNGFGKTVMLKMIRGLITRSLEVFERVPFEEFKLTLDDGTARIVRKRDAGVEPQPKGSSGLDIFFVDAQGDERKMTSAPLPNVPAPLLRRIDSLVPAPYHLVDQFWQSDTGEQFSLADILDKFPRALSALPDKYKLNLFPDDPHGIPLFFVETNRLEATPKATEAGDSRFFDPGILSSTRPNPREKRRIEEYSEDLAQRVKSVLADYAKHSQERDRSFPERLVEFVRSGRTGLSARDILDQMSQLEGTRQRLIRLGFLDSESGLRDLTEEDVKRTSEALTIYVADIQEKLKVFDEMAARVGRLMDIANERFNYKTLTIDRQRGFNVTSHSNRPLALKDLSSGEQHELVLLYELLFRTPQNGLLLVDEPEISFHVAWQSRFLADLISILELTNAYAIVATHSPVVVGPRWDLAVELKGPPELP